MVYSNYSYSGFVEKDDEDDSDRLLFIEYFYRLRPWLTHTLFPRSIRSTSTVEEAGNKGAVRVSCSKFKPVHGRK